MGRSKKERNTPPTSAKKKAPLLAQSTYCSLWVYFTRSCRFCGGVDFLKLIDGYPWIVSDEIGEEAKDPPHMSEEGSPPPRSIGEKEKARLKRARGLRDPTLAWFGKFGVNGVGVWLRERERRDREARERREREEKVTSPLPYTSKCTRLYMGM